MKELLHRRALLLSYITVGYNVLEGVVSILVGYLAGSIALVGFGLDSFVESLAGGVSLWRFWNAAALSPKEEEKLERRAVKLVGYTFFLLGVYVAVESLKKLYFREIPAPTLLGLGIAGLSLVLMPVLYYFKYQTGKALHSNTLMADAKQTLACAFLSLALLVGLGLNYAFGFWPADPLMALVIVGFLFREGYEALHKEKLCPCCSLPPDARPPCS